MKRSYFLLPVILVLVLTGCNLSGFGSNATPPVLPTSTQAPTNAPEPTANLDATVNAGVIAALTAIAQDKPTAENTQVAPTVVPPTPTALIAELPWYAADTVYAESREWKGPYKCIGPAVCEWYVGAGAYFDLEGFVLLREGEYIEFDEGLVGHFWSIPEGNTAIERLRVSFRHLLFYSNPLDAQDVEEIKGYFWDWPDNPQVKSQHAYMHQWLAENNYGDCTFLDQTGCAELEPRVVKPPTGAVIHTDQ